MSQLIQGSDLVLANHKIPLPIVGVVGVAAVIMVMRRHRGGVAVGPRPAPADATGFSGSAVDPTALFGTLSSQLSGLSGQVASLQSAPPPGAGAAAGPSPLAARTTFDSSFGGTHVAEAPDPLGGRLVTLAGVSPDLGNLWGSIAGGANPADVYSFVQRAYGDYGLGAPPSSGELVAAGYHGVQHFQFWAPGLGPPTAHPDLVQSPTVSGGPITAPLTH